MRLIDYVLDVAPRAFSYNRALKGKGKNAKREMKATYRAEMQKIMNTEAFDETKAKALIIEQNLAIKDVAMMVGYHDLAYFYRVFKKHVGIAPGEYRNKHHINKVQ